MKGIVFNLLEEVVIRHHGEDVWDALLDAAGVAGAYTSLGNYPDEDLGKLVAAAATMRAPRGSPAWASTSRAPVSVPPPQPNRSARWPRRARPAAARQSTQAALIFPPASGRDGHEAATRRAIASTPRASPLMIATPASASAPQKYSAACRP